MDSIVSTPKSDDFIFTPDALYSFVTPGADYRFYGRDVAFDGNAFTIQRWQMNFASPNAPKWVYREGFWRFPATNARIVRCDPDSDPPPPSDSASGCSWCGK